MRQRKSDKNDNAPLADDNNRIPLPLRTVEAYEDFTRRLAVDDDVFTRTIDILNAPETHNEHRKKESLQPKAPTFVDFVP
ncbi:unnamed protein product [Dibothriocephalus latus]|uniref:Uncharacterized protein n=1 Tax=Dibothriocephalus latus TaxID=60516 RepID=A0A3P7RAN0_DIBLA|nr:unnamed protein product [Dibothriocephalus latus]